MTRPPAHDQSHREAQAGPSEPDPGSFVGNRPERQAEAIPGGVRPDDERVAAHSSQATGTPERPAPNGHREAAGTDRREAGQDR
jgi:hypothetical protein